MSNIQKMTAISKRRNKGQGMTEYIIVVALIAIAAVVAVSYFGEVVQSQFVNMGSALSGNAAVVTATAVTPEAGTLSDFGKGAK